jgi:septum formation protein
MSKDFVYLASASPRRGELLAQIGVAFEARPADIDESQRDREPLDQYVVRLAGEKATTVWRQVATSDRRAPVLGADTIVIVDGEMLGKPGDAAEALTALERLSGRSHQVFTAVAICFEHVLETELARSEVRFRATTRLEREAYCGSGEPLDKAGSYGIQGLGAVFIEHLAGSYSAVMGLPLFETSALLRRFNLPSWLVADERGL